jgi:hypothetical protein
MYFFFVPTFKAVKVTTGKTISAVYTTFKNGIYVKLGIAYYYFINNL